MLLDPSPEDVFFDLVDREMGQILVDLGNDPALYVFVESPAQIGEGARRRGDDERRGLAFAHEFLHCAGNPFGEAMLLEIVPIGLFYAAAVVRGRALEAAARTVGALLMGGWIVIDKDPLGLQVRKFLVAGIAQEQCLAAVADQNESVVWNCDFT